MNFRSWLGLGCVAAPLLVGAPAFANIIDLGGTGGGVVTIGFQNYKSFGNLSTAGAIQVGSTNFGIFEVQSIELNGNGLFTPGPGGYLLGVFSGITVTSISGVAPNINTTNTGGVFSIYEVTGAQIAAHGGLGLGLSTTALVNQGTTGYANAGCAVNTQCYNGITNVGGVDVLDFQLVPGADLGGSTLVASLKTNTFPPTGSASGFADVTGGTLAPDFTRGVLTTALGTKADLTIADNFCPNGSGGNCFRKRGNWDDQSFDPVRGLLVPEPESLALLGTGLLSLGFLGYRRQKKNDSR